MPAAAKNRWTVERDDCLRYMWKTHSAQQIAEFLGGVTRNAVIGRLGRLGLLGKVHPKKIISTARRKPQLPRPRPPKPVDPVPQPEYTEAHCVMLHLMECDNNACRWIVGKDGWNGSIYCGIQSEYQDCGPYCSMHRPLMYRAPQGTTANAN